MRASPLSSVLFLARHDLRRTLRQRETWMWTFVMPVVFFYFFILIQGGGASSDAGAERLTLVVPDEGGVLVDELETRLHERGFEVRRVAALDPLDPAAKRVLEVPAGFSKRVLAGEATSVSFARDAGGNAFELDRFKVSRAALTVLADVVALASSRQEFDTDALGAAQFQELREWPRSLVVESKPAGKRQVLPSAREQSIPGTMVMFTMILLLTSSGAAIVVDRRQGLLKRLASTPLSRAQISAGKWLAIVGLGFVQIGYAMAVGHWGFGLSWGPDLSAVALVLASWVAFNASLALALVALVTSEAQVVGVSILSANLLAALGGCWWPIEITPRWMQQLAIYLPTGWVMNALHQLMVFRAGPASSWSAVALLALGAAALFAFGSRRFRFD